MTFTKYLQQATILFEKRDLNAALVAYDVAQANAQTAHEHMQVQQMKGIAFRLDRQYDKALDAFGQAIRFANGSHVDIARIQRDMGMVYLDEATVRNGDRRLLRIASELFVSSRTDLITFVEPVEAAASDGFYGRALFIRGDRRAAVRVLERANFCLVGKSDTYELNNLIWLARASVVGRIAHARRARELARRTNQPIRWKEYLVILIGGDHLYRFVKKRKGA